MSSAELRRCLEDCDVAGARKLWAQVAPHLPQPRNDAEALIALHHARTAANSIAFRLRAYSHRWLLDHGYPSGLPDELRPKAERMYPVIADGVGIACRASALMMPIAHLIRGRMSDAVMDAYADGRKEPAFVKNRMMQARDKAKRYFRDLIEDAARGMR